LNVPNSPFRRAPAISFTFEAMKIKDLAPVLTLSESMSSTLNCAISRVFDVLEFGMLWASSHDGSSEIIMKTGIATVDEDLFKDK